MKKAPKAPVAKKPIAKDLPAKRSPKGGSLTATTQVLSNLSRSQFETAQGIIANMKA